MKDIFVLDACALIALIEKEEGADIVRNLYVKAKENELTLLMNRINLLEVYYGSLREYGKKQASKLISYISDSPIEIIAEISDSVFEEAARLKSSYRISLADAIALAEAFTQKARLVTSDHHEFDIIERNENFDFLWVR